MGSTRHEICPSLPELRLGLRKRGARSGPSLAGTGASQRSDSRRGASASVAASPSTSRRTQVVGGSPRGSSTLATAGSSPADGCGSPGAGSGGSSRSSSARGASHVLGPARWATTTRSRARVNPT